jgi:hypothetical protein
MARANQTRNDEDKTGTTGRRAKMVCADWEAGRQVEKSGQARSHRRERQERWLAQGQTAQGSVARLEEAPGKRGVGVGSAKER